MTPCNPNECNLNVCCVTSGHIGTTSGCGSVYFRCVSVTSGHLLVTSGVLSVISGCTVSTSGSSWWCYIVFRSWSGISGGIGVTSGVIGGLPDHRGVLPVSYSMIWKFVSRVRKSSNIAGSLPEPTEAALYGLEVLRATFLIPPPPVVVLIFNSLCAVS